MLRPCEMLLLESRERSRVEVGEGVRGELSMVVSSDRVDILNWYFSRIRGAEYFVGDGVDVCS